VDEAFHGALRLAVQRETAQAVTRSHALAKINGIPSDPELEAATAMSFTKNLPTETGDQNEPLPAWNTVERVRPAVLEAVLNGAL
jgi:hypothetical protein